MFDSDTRTVVVVGAQWGDEGKGKLVDVLAERADWVVRYQGGANAGHTVDLGTSCFILQQIPSGILHPGVRCAIGNGVVLDPETLFTEIDRLVKTGIDVEGRLYVSDRAHLVLPYHKLLDAESSANRRDRHDRPRHRTGVRGQDRPSRHPSARLAASPPSDAASWNARWITRTDCSPRTDHRNARTSPTQSARSRLLRHDCSRWPTTWV